MAKLACTVVLAWAAAAGCSGDDLDVTVELGAEAYDADFGCTNGTVSTVICDPASPSVCTGLTVDADATPVAASPANVAVTRGCDAGTDRCFAQANARTIYAVNVLHDDNFVTKVAQRSISLVHLADLAYTVPINTTTFEVPAVDIYVGPAGTARETDPGVVLVGTTSPIPPGTTVTTAMHLTIEDGSPARALIEKSIQAEQTFVFVLTLAPRIAPGAPIPAGAIEVDLSPQVALGF
ncbi:MAG TPA: hypothetical protein VIK30_09905 [Polyangia bacterium]